MLAKLLPHCVVFICITNFLFCNSFRPISVTNNNVSSRTGVASHVDHNSSAHVARSGRSRTDAVIYN